MQLKAEKAKKITASNKKVKESKGKESKGKESKGKESNGKEAQGKEAQGKEAQGKEAKDKEPEKDKDSDRKGIIMIVSSTVANLLLRSPELLSIVTYYYLSFGTGLAYFVKLCVQYQACLIPTRLANPVFELSLSVNFVFYARFNKAFRLALGGFLHQIGVKQVEPPNRPKSK